ncbi:MAG: hypothetical protein JSY10_05580 [Paenibacillus sp.]|nr:hypothetical protein [Paenibacillus sp.]
MNRFRVLLMNDIRHAGNDPVLMVGFLGPILLILLTRYGFPMAAQWLEASYSFDLTVYGHFAAVLLIVTIPMLLGMMTGLLMLDERDENVISYYAVTPLMKRGYISYRLTLPTILSALLTTMFILSVGLTEFYWEIGLVLVLLALEAPWFALLVAAFAANKVEGLALYKIGALLFIAGPIVVFFVPDVWLWVGVWIPTYWPALVFSTGTSGHSFASFIYFSIGSLYHVAILFTVIRLFIKRMD